MPAAMSERSLDTLVGTSELAESVTAELVPSVASETPRGLQLFVEHARRHRATYDAWRHSQPARVCASCWMQRACCFCAALPPPGLRHKFVLYISARELAAHASSNTGKLLLMWGGELICEGVPEDEARLDELLGSAESTPVVLFPTADAAPGSPALVSAAAPPLRVILLDGNWRAATRMNARIPRAVRRVCLGGGGALRETLGATRKRLDNGAARVQTAPAAVQMLKECGEATTQLEQGVCLAVAAYAAQNCHYAEKVRRGGNHA